MQHEPTETLPLSLRQRMSASGVIATFAIDHESHAVPLAEALWEGGITAIELTLRTPAALGALQAICKEVPQLLVGVGTILTPDQVHQVKATGAAFGVAPGLNPRVIATAREVGLPFAPGIATPSELEQAIEHGCRLVKFFPAEPLGGLAYLRSMSAPYAHLGIEYIPLGGIQSENMMGYLHEPNVLAVGGTWIANRQLMAQQDWSRIRDRAAEVRAVIDQESGGAG